MRYVYSIVRFIPNPRTGERVNLAVVVGNDERNEWGLRRVYDLRRARALDDVGVLSQLMGVLKDLETALEYQRFSFAEVAAVGFTEGKMRRLFEEGGSVLGLSEPLTVSAPSLDDALNIVSRSLLVEGHGRRREPTVRKTAAVAALQEAYERHELERDRDFIRRPRVYGGPFEYDFDFAVRNGSVVQLSQAWSFALGHAEPLGQRIKSWGWSVDGLREKGGTIPFGAGEIVVPEVVDVVVAYVEPKGPEMAHLFEEARYIFERGGVRMYPLTEADAIADRAARSLALSGA